MTNQLKVMILNEEIKRLIHNLNEWILEHKINEYCVVPENPEEFMENYFQVYENLDKLEDEEDEIKELVIVVERLIKAKQEIDI